jgi:MFS family permease
VALSVAQASRAAAHPARGLRWLMWGIAAFLFLLAFVHRVAPGVMAKDLMQAFDATGTMVGLLSAAYFYSYAGFMLPGGLFIDALGARRVVAAGSAVMALGTVAMAMAASTTTLFTGRFVIGAGATVTFIGAMKLGAAWFPPERFGTISALTATVGVLGSLVATAPLAAITAWIGWRGALWLIAGLTFAGAALCVVLVRDAPHEAAHAQSTAPTLREVVGGTLAVLRNPHTWPPFLSFFFLYAAMGNLMLWAVPFLRDAYGLGMTQAAFYASATPLALLASGPLTGWVSDRLLGRRKLPFVTLAAAQLAFWVVFAVTAGRLSLGAVTTLFFAMGLVGSAFVLTWPIGREVNPPELAGSAVAVVNLGGFVGAALTQGPIGAVLDARWAGAMAGGARVYPADAYRAAFLVCVGFMVAAVLLGLLVKETRNRNIYAELRRRGPLGRDGRAN